MVEPNPYETPRSSLPITEHADVSTVGIVTARILFTPEHIIETLERYYQQLSWIRLCRKLIFVASIVFLLFAVLTLFKQSYIVATVMFIFAVCLSFTHKIDEYLARRNFRRSPYYNTQQTIKLSVEGYQAVSELGDVFLKWSAFTSAVIHQDGVLIYQGPKMVHWIPDSALENAADRLAIRQLLSAKLPTSH